jgi:hypothetical protein
MAPPCSACAGTLVRLSNPCQLNELSICGVHNVSKGRLHRAIIAFAAPALSSRVPNSALIPRIKPVRSKSFAKRSGSLTWPWPLDAVIPVYFFHVAHHY